MQNRQDDDRCNERMDRACNTVKATVTLAGTGAIIGAGLAGPGGAATGIAIGAGAGAFLGCGLGFFCLPTGNNRTSTQNRTGAPASEVMTDGRGNYQPPSSRRG